MLKTAVHKIRKSKDKRPEAKKNSSLITTFSK